MTGRAAAFIVLTVLLAALAWRGVVGQRALQASRLVRAVEATSPAAAAAGEAGQRLLRRNLALALEATRLDPASLPAAQALGSVYLLLGRPDDAITSYQRALALQPAAEIYMDLGHAYRAQGASGEARTSYAQAVALDSRLRAQVPAGAL